MSSATRRVTAIYSIDDDGHTWLVHLEEDERCHTYGRTFRQAQANIREAAALWFNIGEADIQIADHLPPFYRKPVEKLAKARERLEADQAEVKELTLDAVRALNSAGLTERDVAKMVGLSHQRVHQLVTGES